MKIITGSLITVFALLLISACNDGGGAKKNLQADNEIPAVADTGFTGIKQYTSRQFLIKEVTFKNGVREGLMKSFYQSGKLRQTFWYENGLREDSAKWYYEQGEVFRSTPYKNDTIDGVQKQYYRNGRLKALLGYKKGFRTPYLEEFMPNGKLVGGYPEIIVSIRDEYKTNGIYRVSLALSDKSVKVRFFQGDFSKGIFDTIQCKKIKTINGTGILNLKKTGSPATGYTGVIAEILTGFGNKNLVYKKIDLPYNDLN